MFTDLRISTLPSIYGEKAVLRLLGNDRNNSLMDIRRLGMEEEQRIVFEHILKAPHGMVLVTGPTGSGKTTTLYAAINRMVKKKINIVTVEDPAEKVMDGITQVQVNSKAGLTFASALLSILRQHPDVLMVSTPLTISTLPSIYVYKAVLRLFRNYPNNSLIAILPL